MAWGQASGSPGVQEISTAVQIGAQPAGCSGGTAQPVSSSSVTSVTVACSDGATPAFGGLPCTGSNGHAGLITTSEKIALGIMAKRNTANYQGVAPNSGVNASSLGALPVCNIMAGEGIDLYTDYMYRLQNNGKPSTSANHNWLPTTSSASNCGKQCGMKIHTSAFSGGIDVNDQAGNCDWEYGQYRGAVMQIQEFYREKVFKEFESKTVNLVNIEGSYPCQELATDIINLHADVNCTTALGVTYAGGPSAAAQLNCPTGASAMSGASGMLNVDPNVIAACNMTMANGGLFSLYAHLLDCEAYWRAANDVENMLGQPDAFVNQVKAYIKPICSGAGSCSIDGVCGCSGLMCCNDDLRTKCWNQCYTKYVPQWLQNTKFKQWSTSTPPPHWNKPMIDGSPGNTGSSPTGGSGAAPSSSSNTSPAPGGSSSHSPGGLWAVALGSLLRRRRPVRGGRNDDNKWWRSELVQLGIAGAIAVVLVGTGCDCDTQNTGACQPCVPANQQQAGCVYKACLSSLFLCVDVQTGAFSSNANTTVINQDNTGNNDTSLSYADNWGNAGAMCTSCSNHMCLAPSTTADPLATEILNTFNNTTTQCWVDTSSAFVDELTAPGNQSELLNDAQQVNSGVGVTYSQGNFLQHHTLTAHSMDDARNTCRQIAGLSAGTNASGYQAQDTTFSSSSMTQDQLTALNTRLTQMAQATSSSGGSDPSCTHANPTTGTPSDGATIAKQAEAELADARGLFGGGAVGASGSGASGSSGTGGGAATAQMANLPPGAGGTPPGAGGPGMGPPPGAGSPGPGGGTTGAGDPGMGGFGGGSDAATAADGGAGASGDSGAVGDATAFEGAGSGGGAKKGGGGSNDPFGGLFGGGGDKGAAGSAGGNVNFGTGDVNTTDPKANADGLLDSKVSLFLIVNKRTDKFAKTLD